MKYSAFLFVLLCFLPFQVVLAQKVWLAGTVECLRDYTVVFEDEFEGEALDTTLWEKKGGAPPPLDRFIIHNCTKELQIYLEDNIVVEDGLLKLIARQEKYNYRGISGVTTCEFRQGEPFDLDFDYTSGFIESVESKNFTFGFYEIKCKVPKGKGFWPAFWMWHHDEIDVFEFFEAEKSDEFTTGIHRWPECSHPACPKDCDGVCHLQKGKKIKTGEDLSSGFHTYSVEWTPWQVVWRLDRNTIRVEPRYYHFNGTPLIADCGDEILPGWYIENPLYPDTENRYMGPIANLAITPFHPPEEETPFPAAMVIDYIKVWQRKGAPREDPVCYICATVFPNPARETASLQLGDLNAINERGLSVEVYIYDAAHRLVWDQSNITEKVLEIDCSGFSSGIYTIFIISDTRVEYLKLAVH